MLKNRSYLNFLAFVLYLSLFLAWTPIIATAAQVEPITAQPINSVNQAQPIILATDYLLDSTAKLALPEILLTDNQSKMRPFIDFPKASGRIWLRLSITKPGMLDLNSRILGLIPGTVKAWLLPAHKAPVVLNPIATNIYTIAEAPAQIYLSIDGLPGLGFQPILKPLNSLNFLDQYSKNMLLALLGMALIISLIRGLMEKREWRMWAALYITALLVNAFWGLPLTVGAVPGNIGPWEMPALFAPGIALLLLPQMGRNLMRTRLEAPKLDMSLLLISLVGLTLPTAALWPSQSWLTRFLPYWPLALILTLPLALQACAKKLEKSYLFLSLIILPIIGIVLISPSLSNLYPAIFTTLGFTPSQAASALSMTPLFLISLSALGLALSPSPGLGTGAVRIPGVHKEKNNKPAPVDENLQIATPAPPATPNLSIIRQPLEAFWETFWRELTFLENKLPLEAKNHYNNLSQAGRNLSQSLQKINGHAPVDPPKFSITKPIPHVDQFDLNQMLLTVHDTIASEAEAKNLALSWFVAPHLPRIYEGDYTALHEVLNLLAHSAVTATDRGIIQLKAGRLPESTDPGHLLFSIADTGKGTPPEKRSTLALVRAWELVGPQGGSLTVDSSQSGTSISFSLHLKPKLAPTQATSSKKPDFSQIQKMVLRIIIASASSSNRQLLAFYLDELPHEILEASSAAEVYTLYTRSPGSLLIFDDDLPLEELSETLAQIRAFEGEHSFPLASILALVSSEPQAEHLRRAGCTHTLLKPILRQKLRHLALRLAPVPKRYSFALDLHNLPSATPSKPMPLDKPPRPVAMEDMHLRLTPVEKSEPKLEQPSSSSAPPPPTYKKGLLSSIFSFSAKTSDPTAPKTASTPKKRKSQSNVGDPTPLPEVQGHVPFKIMSSYKPTTPRELPSPVISQAPDQATEWVGEPQPILKTKHDESEMSTKWLSQPKAVIRPRTTIQPSDWIDEPITKNVHEAVKQSGESESLENLAEAWVGEPEPLKGESDHLEKLTIANAEALVEIDATPSDKLSLERSSFLPDLPTPLNKLSDQPSKPQPNPLKIDWTVNPKAIPNSKPLNWKDKASKKDALELTAPVESQKAAPNPDLIEWVGEPKPISKTNKVTLPKVTSSKVAPPKITPQKVTPPLETMEWVGDPKPYVPIQEPQPYVPIEPPIPIQDPQQALAEPSLPLVDSPPQPDDAPIITLTDPIIVPPKPVLPDLFGDLDNPTPDLEAALNLARQGQATEDFTIIVEAASRLTIIAENFGLHTVLDISACLVQAAETQNSAEITSFLTDLENTIAQIKP